MPKGSRAAGQKFGIKDVVSAVTSVLIGKKAITSVANSKMTKKKSVPSSKTKTKLSTNVMLDKNNDTSYFSIVKEASKKVKTIRHISPAQTWVSDYAGRLTWVDGRQGVATFFYYDAVPILGQMGILPPVDPAGNTSRRFLLDSCKADFIFTNASTASCYVDIFDIVYKRDMESLASDPDNFTPDNSWQTGAVDQGLALGNTKYDSDPRSVARFNQFYKVLQCKEHFLRPGEVHNHKVYLSLKKMVNEELIVEKQRYAGLTYATMIVARGVPVDNDAMPPVVTTSPGAINICMSETCKFRWTQDIDYDLVIGSSYATGVAGTLEVVQDTGVITAVDTA